MNKKLAILEGDGIGPEITAEGLKVLRVIEAKFGHTFSCEAAPFGANAYFSHGDPFPQVTKDACDRADAIVKGPVGLSVDKMETIPQDKRPEIGAILPLRARYRTFANYRPVYLPKELLSFSPLKAAVLKNGIDILMIRELVGGIYFGKKVEGTATGGKYAQDDCVYTRQEVEQIAHVAFKEAARTPSKLMTNIHKANVLATSRFWNQVVEDVRKQYPEVVYKSVLVDNAAYQLVVNPTQFNGVMLFENMQGDILTDQAGGIIGSLGLMPSACIGAEKGYVEPAHGSAPDIAGQDKANPYSMIGSIALMLEKCFGLQKESDAIWAAIRRLFAEGFRSHDLKDESTPSDKVLGTKAFGDMIAAFLR
jgi:3-isopropylmalate dehydrogenase